MSNVATVSFKIGPEHFAVLKAMAQAQEMSVSQFVRETVERSLELDVQARRLAAFFERWTWDMEES